MLQTASAVVSPAVKGQWPASRQAVVRKINACACRCTEDTKGQAQPMAMPKQLSLNVKQQKQSRAIACAACPDEGTGRSPALH
jgi:hypothetical protein